MISNMTVRITESKENETYQQNRQDWCPWGLEAHMTQSKRVFEKWVPNKQFSQLSSIIGFRTS